MTEEQRNTKQTETAPARPVKEDGALLEISDSPAVFSSASPASSSSGSFFDATSREVDAVLFDLFHDLFPAKEEVLRSPTPPSPKSGDFEASGGSILEHPWFHSPHSAQASNTDDNPVFYDKNRDFYRQAKQHETTEGTVHEEVPFSMYYPCYSDLKPEQLEWYFYWRNNLRRRIFITTSPSYVFLYIYELIHQIGYSTPEETLDQILFLWSEARYKNALFDSYLSIWVRDFILYYDLDLEYYTAVESVLGEKCGKYLSQECLHFFLDGERKPGILCALEEYSDYPVSESRFVKDGYGFLLENAVCDVLLEWNQKALEKGSENILASFAGNNSLKSVFPYFSGAVFYHHNPSPRCGSLTVNSKIKFTFSVQTMESSLLPNLKSNKKLRKFITGLLRTVESCLRNLTSFQWSIQAGVLPKRSSDLIQKQTEAFYKGYLEDIRKKEQKTFRVNDDLLLKLKEDSEQIRRQLILEQENSDFAAPPENGTFYDVFEEVEAASRTAELVFAPVQEAANRDTGLDFVPDPSPDVTVDPDPFTGGTDSFSSETDPFNELIRNLDPVQTRVLRLLCGFGEEDGTAEETGAGLLQRLNQIALTKNTFCNVIIEGINEIAVDLVGDCIIDTADTTPAVYDEYLASIKETLNS